jgi:Xaa-Pro aminopeptidase
VTRSYPVSGNWSPEQADLLAVVTAAGAAARACCRPGVEWRDVHLAAARAIAEGLAQFGLLRGDVDTLVESGAVRLFFPHGVGHMVGLGVRDAGEVLPGREGTLPGQPRLRVDLPLMRGHVFTIEPGIYFVPAILDDAEARTQQRAGVDWQLADRMRDFGGIRIEDNVLITEDGCEVLTADIPVA